jgi:hypothetical protein
MASSFQAYPSGMSLTNRVGMAASQRTHARTENEQLQERLAQYEANRGRRQRRRELTVSPSPENRSNVPEDRLDSEIINAAYSLMMFSSNAETPETSKNMRELIRRIDADEAKAMKNGTITIQRRSIKGKEEVWKEPELVPDKLVNRFPNNLPGQSLLEDGSKRTRTRSQKAREADLANAAERASKKAKKSPS